jgi:hypothetical protein
LILGHISIKSWANQKECNNGQINFYQIVNEVGHQRKMQNPIESCKIIPMPILHEKGHLIQINPTILPLSKKLPNFRMIALAQRRR